MPVTACAVRARRLLLCDGLVGGETRGKTDALLERFLSTSDEFEAENQLAILLANHAAPLIEDIVSTTIGQLKRPETDRLDQNIPEVEDIVGEVVLRILNRLRRLKEEPEETSIGDFMAYVNAAAQNACNSYFRARYPDRARFKARLRYLLTHRSNLALWEDDEGTWICGFSQWREENRQVNCEWASQARMHPGVAYLITLGIRLVKAVERIADRLDSRPLQ